MLWYRRKARELAQQVMQVRIELNAANQIIRQQTEVMAELLEQATAWRMLALNTADMHAARRREEEQ